MSNKRKEIAVSDKTALDLGTELHIARQKFKSDKSKVGDQLQGRQRPLWTSTNSVGSTSNSGTKDDADSARWRAKQEQYKRIKRGELESDLLLPSARGFDSSDSDSDEHHSSSSSSDSDRMVEVEDEDGKTMHIPASEFRFKHGQRPSRLLYGDIVQRGAFQLDNEHADQIRNQPDTEDVHYDADWEIRDRGSGFYKFSKDAEVRKQQMESLESIRQETVNQADHLAALKKLRHDRKLERWKLVQQQQRETLNRMDKIGQHFEP